MIDMGLKDRMMDRYMDKLTKEEKLEMMDQMMDKFLEDFSPEERQEMMVKMMPKMMEGIDMAQMMPVMMMQMMPMMMGGMMGGQMEGDGAPMPGMMGSGEDGHTMGGFQPPDMCRQMVEGMREMVETNKAILDELRRRSTGAPGQ